MTFSIIGQAYPHPPSRPRATTSSADEKTLVVSNYTRSDLAYIEFPHTTPRRVYPIFPN